MTNEEFESLKEGDKVVLVDNIHDIAKNQGDVYVLKGVFIPGEVYEVDSSSRTESKGWVSIRYTTDGATGHGWPRERWELYTEPIDDIYKRLGMEVNDVHET